MKKGFTLAELIGVVVIVSLIVLLVAPAMINFASKSKTKLSESTIKLINTATEQYHLDRSVQYVKSQNATYCVTLQTLVDAGYLVSPLFDPKTNANVPLTKYVEFAYRDEWSYEVVDECVEVIDDGATPATYFTWTVSNNEATLTGFSTSKPDDLTEIQIPTKYNGYNVTKIGSAAFKSAGLTKVIFPKTLKEIGANAFEGNLLTALDLPSEVTLIDAYAFASNKLNTKITFPKMLTTIGNYAFQGDSKGTTNVIPEVQLNSGLTSIGQYAFRYNKIRTLVIPNSVTTIGKYGFSDNIISSLVLGTGLTNIRDGNFARNKLTYVNIPQGVTKISVNAFLSNSLTSVDFPSTLVTIDTTSFATNNLSSIVIPNSVTTINDKAFYGNKLISVKIGTGLTTMGGGVFAGNYMNSQNHNNIVSYVDNSGRFPLKNGVIYNSGYTTVHTSITKLDEVRLPDTVTTIKNSAFEYSDVDYVVFNSGLTTIGNTAFAYTNLIDIDLPNSVTTLGTSCFLDAYSTTTNVTVKIGTGMTTIGKTAFKRSKNTEKLVGIINKSGKTFDWSYALIGTASTAFETGTINDGKGDIPVTAS